MGGGRALNAERLQVTAGFFWRGVTVEARVVNLTSAQVGDLADDLASWPLRDKDGHERLILDGFTYDRISGSFTDARQLLAWLGRGNGWRGVFHPQPYEQLGKVLGEMGHAEDRRRVLMKRAELQNKAARARVERFAALRRPWMRVGDWISRHLIGYGYKPWRSLRGALVLIVLGWVVAWQAWHEGSFAPNSDVIVNSAEWQVLARNPDIANPADVWSSAVPDTSLAGMVAICGAEPVPPACTQGQGMDYEAFHSLALCRRSGGAAGHIGARGDLGAVEGPGGLGASALGVALGVDRSGLDRGGFCGGGCDRAYPAGLRGWRPCGVKSQALRPSITTADNGPP